MGPSTNVVKEHKKPYQRMRRNNNRAQLRMITAGNAATTGMLHCNSCPNEKMICVPR